MILMQDVITVRIPVKERLGDNKTLVGYFIGIGYYRMKEYELVIKQMKKILAYEKQNHQAMNLMNEAEKRLKRDGLIGIGVAAGAAAVGSLFYFQIL